MDQTNLTGYLCEICLDAPAVAFVPAPWGGEMGICATCADRLQRGVADTLQERTGCTTVHTAGRAD